MLTRGGVFGIRYRLRADHGQSPCFSFALVSTPLPPPRRGRSFVKNRIKAGVSSERNVAVARALLPLSQLLARLGMLSTIRESPRAWTERAEEPGQETLGLFALETTHFGTMLRVVHWHVWRP